MAGIMASAMKGVGRITAGDLPALREFQRAQFGLDALQLDNSHHRWLFDETPFIDPEGPQLWICRRDDQVVGQQGGIPFTLAAGAQDLSASWAIDLMVAPQWRLRGVGPALSSAHLAARDVTVSLSLTDAAFKSYRRAGWLDLGNEPSFVRVIDPVRCLKVSPYDGGMARMAARGARPMLSSLSLGLSAASRLGRSKLVEIDRFTPQADELWQACRPHIACAARRDHAFLRWRFDESPQAPLFSRFAMMQQDQMMAYAVLRHDLLSGEEVAVVCDYLARPGWLFPLFAQLTEQARREGAAALLCRTLNQQAIRPLSMLGFLTLRNGFRQPTRMMVKPRSDDPALVSLLGNPRNWFVTVADSDMGFSPLGG